jgi:thymidylate synthase (FAD)
MPSPIVRVIGHTKFLGVPQELLPNNPTTSQDISAEQSALRTIKAQDWGSDPARLIECAGRTCYDSFGAGRTSADYHDHILEVGHGSVCEHAVINFYLDGISRGCTHELVRHRAGCAISQRSTRYVDENESPWILHPLIDQYLDAAWGNSDPAFSTKVRASSDTAIAAGREAYRVIADAIQGFMISKGVDKLTARKQARGAARGLLGNALCTSMVWSANIRALRTVIEQRANPAADAEIRVLANRIYEEASLVCPEYFDDYEKVACPDGIGYGLVTKYRKI